MAPGRLSMAAHERRQSASQRPLFSHGRLEVLVFNDLAHRCDIAVQMASFCWPLPTVYTHYYYVRMWGHPNGTATWSQSSDSVDECFPFHWDKLTAYGAFPGS